MYFEAIKSGFALLGMFAFITYLYLVYMAVMSYFSEQRERQALLVRKKQADDEAHARAKLSDIELKDAVFAEIDRIFQEGVE